VPDAAIPDTSTLVELFERSFAQSAAVLARVRPEQLGAPTPCALFDVRTLAGHMLFAARRVGEAGRRQELVESADAVATTDELAAAFDKTAADSLDAWRTPGAFEGDIVLPFGTFPATVVAEIYVLEQITHAWDLAVAIGARGALDESLAEAALPVAEATILPEYRGEEPMPFAAAIEVDATAPAYDRLAAFMGRRPPAA
jgi:uncharacterized protein (TIGR03086 family)